MIHDKMMVAKKDTQSLQGNGVFHEDELTPEQWQELRTRSAECDAGTAVMISRKELEDLLGKRRSEAQAKNRRKNAL